MRGLRLVIGFFFILLPSIFIVVGAVNAWRQHEKIVTYQSVEATVVSSEVKAHRGGKSTTYKPHVEYRYDVHGRSYTSTGVVPVDMNSGQDWANQIVARYPAGSTTTAYFDPASPSDAFLVREYSFLPYMFALFPMIHLGVGFTLVFGVRWTRSPRAAMPPRRSSQPSWFELQPRESLGQKLRIWMILCALWYGFGGVVIGHYFFNADRPYGKLATIGSISYLVLGMLPGWAWLHYFLLMRRTTDAIVMSSVDRFAPAQSFQVQVVQPMHRDTTIESMKVGIVCDMTVKTQSGGKTRYNTVVHYQDWATLLENHDARGDEAIRRTASLSVPTDRPGTTVGKDYPCYEWKIEVRAALRDSPDYKGEFPIHVDA